MNCRAVFVDVPPRQVIAENRPHPSAQLATSPSCREPVPAYPLQGLRGATRGLFLDVVDQVELAG